MTEISHRLSCTSGPIHDKNLCVFCLKARDEKHPTRDKWHLMQTMDAWYAFNAHMTVHLEDSDMRDHILALIDAVTRLLLRSAITALVGENMY